MIEEFDKVIAEFMASRDSLLWGIQTELLDLKSGRPFKATILYSQRILVTAHSDVSGDESSEHYEKQAMVRAIGMLAGLSNNTSSGGFSSDY